MVILSNERQNGNEHFTVVQNIPNAISHHGINRRTSRVKHAARRLW